MRSSFTRLRDSMDTRLRDSMDRLRDSINAARAGSTQGEPGSAAESNDQPGPESNQSEVSPIAMSQTDPKVTEEQLEAIQNTDPVSDPSDDLTTGDAAGDAAQQKQPVDFRDAAYGAQATSGLREETERLRAERDGLLDRLARLQAEFENARRRADRERGDFREYATGSAVEQFLPVLDNFALALKATGSADQLRTGVELIVKQMEEVLRGLNVQTVETVGTPFDPRFHEALDQVENSGLPDGQVYEEVRRGYRIKERLLRPALVRIVSNPNQKQA